MRLTQISGLLLAFVGLCMAQEKPIPVEQEPHHKIVLQNDLVQVMHVTLSPGERTLYHTHSHDRAAVELSACSITQQSFGGAEGPPSPTQAGDLSMSPQINGGYSHRVHNVASVMFEVLDIEFLRRPEKSSDALAGPIAAENPSARAYKWTLAPGTQTPQHTHTRPYLIVMATPMQLKMTAPDGQSFTHTVKAGDFHWVDAPVTHVLSNDGSTAGTIVELELK
jgi:quercetin dioxygenase-like cupin family protein